LRCEKERRKADQAKVRKGQAKTEEQGLNPKKDTLLREQDKPCLFIRLWT
jgi:hypothetical protein